MAIKLIELNKFETADIPRITAAPALTVAVLIIPIFDTIRIFFIRIKNGVSPFVADRNHIHHRVLRLGYTHLQTTLFLAAFNLLAIGIALVASPLGNFAVIIIVFITAMLCNWGVSFIIRNRDRESVALRNLFV